MPEELEIMHYTGYASDRGGVVAVIRALDGTGLFRVIHGVSAGFRAEGSGLKTWPGPEITGEKISLSNGWRARGVAREVGSWLAAEPQRFFHGHSRAGLLVALWLHFMGESRVVVSVHCYGRQRWFYRWAARRLGRRLFWLSPAMRTYYGVPGREWEQCIPGGVLASRVMRQPGATGLLRLGCVGALVRWKGWHHVLAALALLPPDDRARVIFTQIGAGSADYLAALRRQAAESGLAAQVNFRGAEASSQGLLGEIDVLVVASEKEPFSMAVLEALAAGVPVLAADTGGAQDIVVEGVNGALYRTGDPRALADRLRCWLAQPPAWDAEKIRATTIPIARVARQWADVYATLGQA